LTFGSNKFRTPMQATRFLINATGAGSWLALIAYAVTGSITFHPSVLDQAKMILFGHFALALILAFCTLILAILVVPIAEPDQMVAALAQRKRQALWRKSQPCVRALDALVWNG
jgi:hypothetical protein